MAKAAAGLARLRALLAAKIGVEGCGQSGWKQEFLLLRSPVDGTGGSSSLRGAWCRQFHDRCAASARLVDGKARDDGVLHGRLGHELSGRHELVLSQFPSFACARSFAAYRTLLQKPRGGARTSADTRKRDVVGGRQEGVRHQSRNRPAFGDSGRERKVFVRRKEDAPFSSDRAAGGPRKEWQGKRKARQSTALGNARNSPYSVQRGDRSSGVIRPRSLERFQHRRRPFEDDDDEEVQHKRRRRVMRLHPRDQTNKRIEEDAPVNTPSAKLVKLEEAAKTEEVDKKDPVSSQNARFKAIQPSPEILRHIDSHLLGLRRLWEWRKGGYHTKLKAPLDDVPNGSKDGRLPIQETVFKRKLTFIAAAKVSSSLPSQALPEIAFAGRSNVGKSSLINALTRQWGVVRTSDKPGLTQSINFFTLGARLCLVDLPGYGFAYAKEEAKEAWEDLVKEYVTTRKGLKRVCLLVDAKWGLKPRDEELIYLMENAQTKYQVVLTKTDILAPIDLARRATQIQEALKHSRYLVQPVMMVSSQTGGGIPHLRQVLANLAISSPHQP